MIELGSSNKLHALPNKEFGHATDKSHYNPGFRRGARLLSVRRELGRACASRLLRRNVSPDGVRFRRPPLPVPHVKAKTMIFRCIAFVFAALALANCCISGSGCGTPAGGPVAWDGLGPAPVEDKQAAANPAQDTKPVDLRPTQPSTKLRTKKQDSIADTAAPQDGNSLSKDTFKDRFNDRSNDRSNDSWEHQQAADRDDERRLKQKLIICRDCGATAPNKDDATVTAATTAR